ncbi:inositol monophosphatase 3-like [Asterias amurensis]|uniref:inositol monophosphatase 3-like n=1 Tax=Asterias amurensis TaxID=7602 RepID=UPI003AB84D29
MVTANMANIRISPISFVLIFLLAGAVILYVERSWHSDKGDQLIVDSSTKIDLKALLSAGIGAAERGGVEVKKVHDEHQLNAKSKGETREGANNPVTDGDMRSHKAIVHGLKKTFPSLKVVSEEHETDDWDKSAVVPLSISRSDVIELIKGDQSIPLEDVTVWVDPLDATQEYTDDLLHYVTTMVCVAVRGVPTIGIIHKPFMEAPNTVWAFVGQGHSPNLKLPVKKADLSTSPKIIVSRSHQGEVEAVAKTSFGKDTEVIPAGGAGYKVWSLFEGKADAYIHTTLIKKWDICAGNALLNEFKGKMTTLKGNDIDYSWSVEKPDPKNEGGLLASLWEHKMFLDKLAPVVDKKQ